MLFLRIDEDEYEEIHFDTNSGEAMVYIGLLYHFWFYKVTGVYK